MKGGAGLCSNFTVSLLALLPRLCVREDGVTLLPVSPLLGPLPRSVLVVLGKLQEQYPSGRAEMVTVLSEDLDL